MPLQFSVCKTSYVPHSLQLDAVNFEMGNNPAWKGGHKNTRDYGPNWQNSRKAALERDDYKCQHCSTLKSNNGRGLDVHHIIPFRYFGYIRGVNNNDVIVNRIDNLITLCRRFQWAVEPYKKMKSAIYHPLTPP